MKYKFSAALLGFLILFSCMRISVTAESYEHAVDKANTFIDGIVVFHQTDGNIQEWIDGSLSENAGIRSEWYILALSQYNEYDFSKYEENLLSYLSENDIKSASSREKYALCLSAIGSRDSYISAVLKNAIGEQGIMSWIYGLHLLNNGYHTSEHTVDSLVSKLLSLQLSDGGFAVTGEFGNVDVTAMSVQALAPYYANQVEVKTAVEKALSFLSTKQSENGAYASYGVYNPESTAQVLVALSSLGIDCMSDARFIKNGNTLFDGIEKYRLANGSFCHQEGGEMNESATVQVFYAMVSYLRMTENKTPLYILDHADPEHVEPAPTLPAHEESAESTTGASNLNPTHSLHDKLWAIVVIIAIAVTICIVLLVLKKKNIKNLIAVLLVAAIAIAIVLVTDFRSADDYYNGDDIIKENVIGQVTMTIRCDTVVGKSDSEYIPKDGIILDFTEFDIEEGDSVYDILIEAARKYHIQIENEGNAEMAYISGIQYLYEFDYGDLSGWVYHVNGTAPSVGCGNYILSDGDIVEWHYSMNLGKDIASEKGVDE